MKVSVVTPTGNREHHMQRLHKLFTAQTHDDKELLVLDSSSEPSNYFSSIDDSHVRYIHTDTDQPVGEKRNLLVEQASGDVIVQFDDDDYYAPNYIKRMLHHLGDNDFAKMQAFFIYSQTHDLFGYWDTGTVSDVHVRLESGQPLTALEPKVMEPEKLEVWQSKNLLGYGFSYVFKKSVWDEVKFEPLKQGEDFQFLKGAQEFGFKLATVVDQEGLVLYIRHTTDSSVIMPQFMLPRFVLPMIFGENVNDFLK